MLSRCLVIVIPSAARTRSVTAYTIAASVPRHSVRRTYRGHQLRSRTVVPARRGSRRGLVDCNRWTTHTRPRKPLCDCSARSVGGRSVGGCALLATQSDTHPDYTAAASRSGGSEFVHAGEAAVRPPVTTARPTAHARSP